MGFPVALTESRESVDEKLAENSGLFARIWQSLSDTFACPIIQDNFAMPPVRPLGNMDSVDFHGLSYAVNRMNAEFVKATAELHDLHIHDVNYLAARLRAGTTGATRSTGICTNIR